MSLTDEEFNALPIAQPVGNWFYGVHPWMRDVIDVYHGNAPVRVRPTNRIMEAIYMNNSDAACDPENIQGYAILDHEGWRRDLFPLEIQEIVTESSLFGDLVRGSLDTLKPQPVDKKVIHFKSLRCEGTVNPCGVAIEVADLGWIINPFEDRWYNIEPTMSLKCSYTCDRWGDMGLQTYIPYDDVSHYMEKRG